MTQRSKYLSPPKRLILTVELISGFLILLFFYTALSKLWAHGKFTAVLQVSPVLSAYAGLLSWQIPLSEVVLAILLLIPATRKAGLICSTVLLTAFTIYLGYMLLFTPDRPCSCGGVIQHMSWGAHIVLNLGFIALALLGIRITRKIDLWAEHTPP